MINRWVRSSDFFASKKVAFMHIAGTRSSDISIIKEINVEIISYRYPIVSIIPSPKYQSEVDSIFLSCFPEHTPKWRSISNTVDIPLNTASLPKFKKFFAKLNEFIEKNNIKPAKQFPSELIDEFHVMLYPRNSQKHIISNKINFGIFNPSKQNSTELIELFRKERHPETFVHDKQKMRRYKQLLVRGYNVNQFNSEGISLFFYIAVHKYHPKIWKFALIYGGIISLPVGNPLDIANGIYKFSALELLLQDGQIENANIVANAYAKPQKALSTPKQTLVKDIKVFEKDKVTFTFLKLYNSSSIETCLKSIENLTPAERKELLESFSKMYTNRNRDPKIVIQEFEEDFSPNPKCNGKLVEMVFLHDATTGSKKLIGFNLFLVLLNVSTRPVRHTFICQHSDLDIEFRHMGLGFFLALRMAFSLHILMGEHITVRFSAISYDSYQIVEDIEHSPKNWPEHYDREEVLEVGLEREYQTQVKIVSDLMTCYVDEAITVRDTQLPKTIWAEFFHDEILGYSEYPQQPQEASRGGLIMVDIGDKFLNKMSEKSARMGIDFITHMYHLGLCLPKLIRDLGDKKPNMQLLRRYPSTVDCFWYGFAHQSEVDLLKPKTQFKTSRL